MNLIKYQIILLVIIHGYILPLGGFGFLGLMSSESIDGVDNEGNPLEALALNFNSNKDLANAGGGFFIYFDALPKKFAIEFSNELAIQPLNTNVILYNEFGSENLNLSDWPGLRTSNYITVRKEMFGLSIPLLAKAAIYLGAGYNTHLSILPSIDLLKDIIDDDSLSDDEIFDTTDNDLEYNFTDILEHASDTAIKTNGFHIQAGLQGKILSFNTFINAKYTFAELPGLSAGAVGFPSFTIGLALGI